MVEKEEYLKKEQANLHPVDISDIQEDSTTEVKCYCVDELQIMKLIEQVSLIGERSALPFFFQK